MSEKKVSDIDSEVKSDRSADDSGNFSDEEYGSDHEQDTTPGRDPPPKDSGHQPGSEGNALVPSPSKTHELSRFSEMHLSANTTDQETAGEEATEAAANSTPRTESATSKADAAAVNTDLEQTQYTQDDDLFKFSKEYHFERYEKKDIYLPLFNAIKRHYDTFPGLPLDKLLWKCVPKSIRNDVKEPLLSVAVWYFLDALPTRGEVPKKDGWIYHFTSRKFWLEKTPEQKFAKLPERLIEPVKVGYAGRNKKDTDSAARIRTQDSKWTGSIGHLEVPTEYCLFA
eukprot:scpid90339/ scgid29162/ 